MGKNAKFAPFFYKEGEGMQRSFRSFIKNGKECKKRSVLSLRSFEKNGCLTLDLAQ